MSQESRAAGETAAAMVRSAISRMQGDRSPGATAEAIALELTSQDGAVEAAQALVALAGIGAAAILLLAGQSGRTTEEYLSAFVDGIGGEGHGHDT